MGEISNVSIILNMTIIQYSNSKQQHYIIITDHFVAKATATDKTYCHTSHVSVITEYKCHNVFTFNIQVYMFH